MTTTPSFELGQDHLDLQRVGARLRRRRDPPRGRRVGRARGVPLAGHPGGRQGRLYSLDFSPPSSFDPTGLGFPMAMEELFWGDAGIGLSIVGTGARRRRRPRQRHRGADRRVDPADVRRRRRRQARAPSAPPSPTPAPTSARCAPGRRTTRPRTSGCSTAPRPGPPTAASPTSTSSSPSSTPSCGSSGPGQLHRPAGHPGPEPGPEVQEARHPRLAHRRGRPRRRPRPRPLPARRQGEARRAAGPGPRGRAVGRGQRRRWRRSRRPARRSAPWPSASPGPRTRSRSTTPRPASSSAGRSSRTRRSPSSSPTCAPRSTRRGCWSGGPRGWPRQGKPFDAAEGSMSKLFAGETAMKVTGAGDPDPRRQRLHPRVPGRADGPRRQDLHDLRGHQRDPAAGDRPDDLGSAHPLMRDKVRDPVFWHGVTQLVKTVVAAVVAWVIAASTLDLPQPFLAPWAALLVVHATVYRTFSPRPPAGGRQPSSPCCWRPPSATCSVSTPSPWRCCSRWAC